MNCTLEELLVRTSLLDHWHILSLVLVLETACWHLVIVPFYTLALRAIIWIINSANNHRTVSTKEAGRALIKTYAGKQ